MTYTPGRPRYTLNDRITVLRPITLEHHQGSRVAAVAHLVRDGMLARDFQRSQGKYPAGVDVLNVLIRDGSISVGECQECTWSFPEGDLVCGTAVWSDRSRLCEIAGQSPYTKGFVSPHFCHERAFFQDRVHVVRQGNMPVGFASLTPKSTHDEVTFFAVDRRLRRRGIGRLLFSTLPHSFQLSVDERNTDALAFYKARGCVDTGPGKKGFRRLARGQ